MYIHIETSFSRILFTIEDWYFLWRFIWWMSIYYINILSVCLSVKLQKKNNVKICYNLQFLFDFSIHFSSNFKELRYLWMLSSLLSFLNCCSTSYQFCLCLKVSIPQLISVPVYIKYYSLFPQLYCKYFLVFLLSYSYN